MIRVSIIGSGNVAQHLIKVFSLNTDIELVQIFVRNKKTVLELISADKIFSNYKDFIPVDVVIIAVTDGAIELVYQELPFTSQLIVHTSGTFSLEVLKNKNRIGVFYPLQTFSKSKEVDFKTIPICIEAQNENDYKTLECVAHAISNSVHRINAKQRLSLHVAAVYVCNFTNYMYTIGNDICNLNNLSFEILKPLIQETANKIMLLSPAMAQTGPAIRKDTGTLKTHLDFLTNNNQKEIYKLLTKSIIDNGNKL
jgi:predicted short-subunit dehydrogenase-like oxidoreductase (DUF2520 family)